MNKVILPKGMQSKEPQIFSNLIQKLCEEIGLEKLKNVVENNVSHRNESVYDHTLNICNKFQKYLSLEFIGSKKLRKEVSDYFEDKIGNHSRAELFILSAFMHDIGKLETVIEDKNGMTTASGHEKISAQIAKEALSNFAFSKVEITYIYDLVRMHAGFSFRFLDYLESLTENQLKTGIKHSLLLPEIFMYQIADNESAPIFAPYKKFILEYLLQLPELYECRSISQETKKSLDQLFTQIKHKLNIESKPWPEEARMLHLSEEVGELHDIYLQTKGAKDREQTIEHIKGALNDVMFELIALYDLYELNISDSLEEELRKNE